MSELCKGVKEEAKESCKGERGEMFSGDKECLQVPRISQTSVLFCISLVESMGAPIHADTAGKDNAACLFFNM